MMNIEDGFFINTMGGCNHSQVAIFLNGGCDRGDEVRSPDYFFGIEIAHVGGGFACFNLLYDSVDRCFMQGLITIGSVNGHFSFCFNFLVIFAAPDEIGNEVSSTSHIAVSEE
jgi:hypothetical protein